MSKETQDTDKLKNISKYLIWSLVAFIFLVVLILVGYVIVKDKSNTTIQNVQGESTKNVADQSDITKDKVIVTIKTDIDTSFYPVEYKVDETVFSLLKRLDQENENFSIEYKEYDFGIFITSINKIVPDQNTEFWKFFINDTESQVGVSDYKVQKGDKITFSLDKISF